MEKFIFSPNFLFYIKIRYNSHTDINNYFHEYQLFSFDDENQNIILFKRYTNSEIEEYLTFFVTDFLLINLDEHYKSFIKAYELIDFSSKYFRTHLIDLNLNPKMNYYNKVDDVRELAFYDAYIRN